jgi:hypothetical protein
VALLSGSIMLVGLIVLAGRSDHVVEQSLYLTPEEDLVREERAWEREGEDLRRAERVWRQQATKLRDKSRELALQAQANRERVNSIVSDHQLEHRDRFVPLQRPRPSHQEMMLAEQDAQDEPRHYSEDLADRQAREEGRVMLAESDEPGGDDDEEDESEPVVMRSPTTGLAEMQPGAENNAAWDGGRSPRNAVEEHVSDGERLEHERALHERNIPIAHDASAEADADKLDYDLKMLHG